MLMLGARYGAPTGARFRRGVATPGSFNRASKFRGSADFYPTPSGATQALCDLNILPSEIWEPACGNGALSKILEECGHRVLSSDLNDYGYGHAGWNFLHEKKSRIPTREWAIVTNPPFNIANEFVSHALSLQPTVAAFLLRLKFLEGRSRYDALMRDRPPAEVYVFIERVKFFSGDYTQDDQPGWNTEAFAWFVWRKDVVRPPQIHWISRGPKT